MAKNPANRKNKRLTTRCQTCKALTLHVCYPKALVCTKCGKPAKKGK